MVEAVDVVAVTMQVTLEAVGFIANRGPREGTAWHSDVGVHKELQVITSLDVFIHDGMASERASSCNHTVGYSLGRRVQQAEVEEVLQLGSSVGGICNINLALALHILVIHIVVVLHVFHHLCQVVVVGHAHLYMVRIGLAEVCLRIVSEIEAILIPVERVEGRHVVNAIDMTLGISNLLEEFPAATRHLVCTWCYMRFTDADERARQHNLRCLDVLDGRNTTLEHDMDVHYVALTNRSDVCTADIAFFVVILIDHGDDLLLREVEDI